MCYSSESSLYSFFLGTSASLYLLFFKVNNHIGLIFLTVVLMQLLEYFIWIDQECKGLNQLSSKLTVPVLGLQALSVFVGGILFNTMTIPKDTLYIIVSIFLLLSPFSLYLWYKDSKEWCSKPGKNGSLVWPNIEKKLELYSIERYMYYGAMFAPVIFFKEKFKPIIYTILGILTTIYTFGNSDEQNSKWCYYQAYVPLIFVLLDLHL